MRRDAWALPTTCCACRRALGPARAARTVCRQGARGLGSCGCELHALRPCLCCSDCDRGNRRQILSSENPGQRALHCQRLWSVHGQPPVPDQPRHCPDRLRGCQDERGGSVGGCRPAVAAPRALAVRQRAAGRGRQPAAGGAAEKAAVGARGHRPLHAPGPARGEGRAPGSRSRQGSAPIAAARALIASLSAAAAAAAAACRRRSLPTFRPMSARRARLPAWQPRQTLCARRATPALLGTWRRQPRGSTGALPPSCHPPAAVAF